MAEQVVIAERFKGPPGSGHGGYSCAMAAQFIAGPAEVALRRPPPLEIPLEVQTDSDGTVRLLHGDAVVAEARATELELEVPEPVGVEDAGTAALRSPLLDYHPFATCFVCGTDREPGDGVRLFAGPVEGRELYAAPWIPAQDMAGPDGVVVPEFVWSVLDCPGGMPRSCSVSQECRCLRGWRRVSSHRSKWAALTWRSGGRSSVTVARTRPAARYSPLTAGCARSDALSGCS